MSIYTRSEKDCGDDVDLWRGRYIALRDRWRECEKKIKAETDGKKKARLEARLTDIGAERNKTMGRIAQLVNRQND